MKSRVGYIIFIIILFLFSVSYNDYTTNYILLLFVVCSIVYFIIVLFFRFLVSVHLLCETDVVRRGERLKLNVKISNKFILPVLGLELHLSFKNDRNGTKDKEKLLFSCNPRKSKSYPLELSMQKCGKVTICLEAVYFRGYFGICRLKKKLGQKYIVMVLPCIYPIDLEISSEAYMDHGEAAIYSKHKAGDDPGEIYDIREFTEGDRLQNIHWKLTEKQNKLMVKQFSQPIGCGVVLLVELRGKQNSDDIDILLESAFSIAAALLERKCCYYFCWFEKRKGFFEHNIIFNEDDLNICIQTLVTAQLYEEDDKGLLYFNTVFEQIEYYHCIYLTAYEPKDRLLTEKITVFNVKQENIFSYLNGMVI